jgi:SAM-dependent methyltransferase
MAPLDKNRPIFFDDPADLPRLRDALRAASFTERGVAEAIGLEQLRSISSAGVAELLLASSGGRPVDTLVRLFLMGMAVDAAAATAALTDIGLDTCVCAGLLVAENGRVRAALELLPYRSLVLAFDWPPKGGAAMPADYVMGVGSSSLTLANATIRRRSRATLDLGAGCGFQALLAAEHSDEVAAVDLNPRAVCLADFNARLNDLPHVECLQGSFFEPVAGRRFDLVVSNPPFVISPESRYIYRDSGLGGDEVIRDIVRQVPAFLHDGGYCQILCNWAEQTGEDWRERLGAWFEDCGCDAWVMRSDTLEPAAYAAKWIRHTERDSPEQFAERHRRWVDYYQANGIEAISGGVISMRRREAGVNWFRADEAPKSMLGPIGAMLVRGFELRDFLESVRDDRLLLDQCLVACEDLCLQQRLKPAAGGWLLSEAEVYLDRGLAYRGNIDAYTAELIGQCDGRRRLGELLCALAAQTGAEPAAIVPASLGVIRAMIEQGFLLPSPVAANVNREAPSTAAASTRPRLA